MNTDHLSAWEQEEYLLNERTPDMLRHLTECVACRDAVQRLEKGVAVYRSAAVEWSAQCLATRPQRLQAGPLRPIMLWRWAFAAVLPLIALLALLPLFLPRSQPVRPVAQISDDALLEQVDEQLSVAVPSSMESLTHLVSTENNGSGAATNGSKPSVQTN